MSGFESDETTCSRNARCARTMATIALLLGLPGLRNVAAQSAPPFPVVAPWETVVVEHEDRMRRLKALASLDGTQHPDYFAYSIDQAQHKLRGYPTVIPVLRVVFRDQVFFDSNQDEMKQEA